MYLLVSKFRFLEFRLLLSRVAPYYIALPRTVWFSLMTLDISLNWQSAAKPELFL